MTIVKHHQKHHHILQNIQTPDICIGGSNNFVPDSVSREDVPVFYFPILNFAGFVVYTVGICV